MLDRRAFLAALTSALTATWTLAAEATPDLKITRVIGFRLPLKRSKLAGRNARLDVHGDTSADRLVRLKTNVGVEGIGSCRAPERDATKLLGKNPFELYDQSERRMNGPLGAGTMPLWDLAGKVLKKPVYELLGGAGPERVPVYDGSIYFADLLPQYADRWQERLREEIDMGLEAGHRAFKIKVGRGNKWMSRQEGDDRDVAVVEVIRQHAGPDVLLGVDANNGYDLPGARRFLERTAPSQLAFAEELFPETVEECLELKRFIHESGWKTLVADGETQRELEAYRPFMKARAIDVFQGDMNHYGIEGIMTEAAWAAPEGLRVAPHNWGSLIGYYLQLHVGKAIGNFYRAEHDPLSTPVLSAEGYNIAEGTAGVPEAPGFGLSWNEEAWARECPIDFDLRA